MFGIFKRLQKKPLSINSISERIIQSRKKGIEYLTINLWIEDQILFQVGFGKQFEEYGINIKSDQEMFVIHFFNKKKTLTITTWEKLKKETNSEFTYFENPKGNHNYMKSLGISPNIIAKNIFEEIKLYGIREKSRIGIQFVEQ